MRLPFLLRILILSDSSVLLNSSLWPAEVTWVQLYGYLTLFSGANAVGGATSSASFTPVTTSGTTNGVVFASGYANPELSRDTGEIIYVENRRAISRASDQTEDIKVVVEF